MNFFATIAAILSCVAANAQSTTVVVVPGDRRLVDAQKIIGDGSPAVFIDTWVGPTKGYTPPPLGPVASTSSPLIFFGPRFYSYSATGRFVNLSVKAPVGSGDQSLTAGMVIGAGGRIVLVRAVGPSLAAFGITTFVLRPQLQIFDSKGTRIAQAVPWSSNDATTRAELRKTAEDVGAFALREGSDDQVLMLVLESGAYTCVVSGEGASTGTVLLETFEVPQ